MPHPSIANRAVAAARRFVRGLGHARDGLVYITHTQINWAFHLAAGILALGAAWALGLSSVELAILVVTIGLVLSAEALNTALEAAVDATGRPPSLAAKHAKDAGAGAVLVAALTALAVGILLFGPRLAGFVRID